VGWILSFVSLLTSGLEITLLAECPLDRGKITSLGDRWSERIDNIGGISNQIVKYDLGFPSIEDQFVSLHHDDIVALMARMLHYKKFQTLLKNKFPIIFIDEYQDTNSELASSIVKNLVDNDSGIVVGLFGDHWQKIYGSSACGLVQSEKGKIIEIGKKANFRSDKNIVDCLNRIRPELPQAESDPDSQGAIRVYHSNSWKGNRRTGAGGGHWKDDLPEEDVKIYLEKVKEIMVFEGWSMSPKETKILMLTNNLIATEQKFNNLASFFKYTDDYLKKNDKYIQFFLDVVEPTAIAYEKSEYGELFQIGKQTHPHLKSQDDKKAWSDNLSKLIGIRQTGSIGDVLAFLSEYKTPRLSNKVSLSEERYKRLIAMSPEDLEESDSTFIQKIKKLKSVDYQEVVNLALYIDEKTPFSTKHGVKGAEFDNVLVVFGRGWNHYNWNQMLEWLDDGCPNGKEEMFERNRNLFYVSCSRPKHNLTILFTQELSLNALSKIENIFGLENVIGDPFLMTS
jgi:DNA helicase-2/ATP-dependent DNA helicase PcrA